MKEADRQASRLTAASPASAGAAAHHRKRVVCLPPASDGERPLHAIRGGFGFTAGNLPSIRLNLDVDEHDHFASFLFSLSFNFVSDPLEN